MYRVKILNPDTPDTFTLVKAWEVDCLLPNEVKELITNLKPGQAIQIERTK